MFLIVNYFTASTSVRMRNKKFSIMRTARATEHRGGHDVGAEAFGKGAQGFPLLVSKAGQRIIVGVLRRSGGFLRLYLVHFVFRGRSGFGFLLRFGLGFASRRGFKRVVGQINDRRDGRLDGRFLCRFGGGFLVQFNRGFCVQFLRSFFRKFVINPTFSDNARADIDIMVGATIDNILMVEGEMNEVSEADMLEAIKFAHEEIKKQCAVQIELMKELGKDVKRTYCHEVNDEELRQLVIRETYDKVYAVATSASGKQERTEKFEEIEAEFCTRYTEEELAEKLPLIKRYFHDDVLKKAMRRMILDEGKRLDGRRTDEIRPIWCEVGPLPAAHGSAIFTRGETQSLTTVTLGTKLDEKQIDQVLVQGSEQFVLHYNFPPFSTGEAKPARGLSRREIGHGNLAWRALKPMVPVGEENPYAVRVVSDILESNGSSSMATVCAGTLALMDSGLKLKKPVSGIAMGLISDSESDKYAILSDILGDEDHLGDMDFKVAGTRDGITATQMDIKVDGLSYEVLAKALEQARVGRLYIMDKLTDTIAEPREDFRPFVPRIVQITIPSDFIGAVIGPGGKVIQEIQKTTGTTITITEEDNKGIVDIFGENKEGMDAALARIKAIVAVPEVGEVYNGKIRSIVAFGAFVEILPGKDALLHISEIDYKRFETMDETGLKEGDMIEVKLIGMDPKTGKLKLSHKALLPKPEGYEEPEKRERRDRGERSEKRDGKHERREHKK